MLALKSLFVLFRRGVKRPPPVLVPVAPTVQNPNPFEFSARRWLHQVQRVVLACRPDVSGPARMFRAIVSLGCRPCSTGREVDGFLRGRNRSVCRARSVSDVHGHVCRIGVFSPRVGGTAVPWPHRNEACGVLRQNVRTSGEWSWFGPSLAFPQMRFVDRQVRYSDPPYKQC